MSQILKNLFTPNLVKNLLNSGDDSKKIAELQSQNDTFKKQLDGMQNPQNFQYNQTPQTPGMKKGGKVKSASARADGCCIRGKTRA